MADLAFSFDFKDILEARKAIVSLERQITDLTKRYSRGAVSIDQYNLALRNANRIYRELGTSSSRATVEIHKYAKGVQESLAAQQKERAEQERLKKSMEELRRQRTLMEGSQRIAQQQAREEEKVLRESTQALLAHEREIEELTRKYNPAAAAANLYEAEIRQMSQALDMGVIDIDQHAAAIQKLDLQYEQFSKGSATASNIFVQNTNRSTRSVSHFGLIAQQSGYQIGDFLVQVQSGTNPLVAFGQQATQVAGTLTLLGGKMLLIGTALGILIPLSTALGAAWMRTREAQNKASEATSDLEESLKSLDGTLQDWNNTKRAASAGITVEELFGIQGIDEAVSAVEEAREKLAKIVSVGETPGGLNVFSRNLIKQQLEEEEEALAELESAEKRLADLRQRQSEQQMNAFLEQRGELENSLALQREIVRSGSESLAVKLLEINQEAQARQAAIAQQLQQNKITSEQAVILAENVEKIRQFNIQQEQAKDLAGLVAGAINSIDFSRSIAGAGLLVQRLGAAYQRAVAIAKATSEMRQAHTEGFRFPTSTPTGSSNPFWDSRVPMSNEGEMNLPEYFFSGAPGGGGTGSGGGGSSGRSGGGGSGAAQQDTIGALAQSLLTEREKIDLWYEESLVKLQEFNSKELEILGGHNEAKERLEREFAERLSSIRDQERFAQLNHYGEFFGIMAGVFESGGEKLLGISKAFSLAQASISIWTGAAKALELPFPQNLVAWGKVLATGAKAIQGISGASRGRSTVSGGSGGGGSSNENIRAPEPQQTAQRVLLQGLDPDALFTGQMLSDFFEKFYEENNNRGKIFVVAN